MKKTAEVSSMLHSYDKHSKANIEKRFSVDEIYAGAYRTAPHKNYADRYRVTLTTIGM